VLFGTAVLVSDDREHFARLSIRLDPPRDDLQTARSIGRRPFDESSVDPMIICFAGVGLYLNRTPSMAAVKIKLGPFSQALWSARRLD
jgi:hypothetical protein